MFTMRNITNSLFAILTLTVIACTTLASAADASEFRWGQSAQQRKLTAIIIPKLDLEKATLREALDVLGVQIKNASKEKLNPNFIIKDLNAAFKNKAVTLRLNQIPADVILQYIADQVGGKIRYDKHAIIIYPRS